MTPVIFVRREAAAYCSHRDVEDDRREDPEGREPEIGVEHHQHPGQREDHVGGVR
ncbi:MAG: hypothetical protein WD276_09260 [Actinomycetota bacterium]